MDIRLFDKKLFNKRLKLIKKATKKSIRSWETQIYFEASNNIVTAFWTNGKIALKFKIGVTSDDMKGIANLEELTTDDHKLTINLMDESQSELIINQLKSFFDLKSPEKGINRSHLGTEQLLLALNILQQESFVLRQTKTKNIYHGYNVYNTDEFIIMGYTDLQ